MPGWSGLSSSEKRFGAYANLELGGYWRWGGFWRFVYGVVGRGMGALDYTGRQEICSSYIGLLGS